eukprot:CAMPEP_0194481230 /NCGR_PEP_ID=MMETSP0253-20130528/3750_1 /TAXON_ID=2966 /ORGANISM="Noctiluca scintillans" /LENGTH=293 /DNA_ID=CAMNT_0039320701 /DNA_START=34 /DNA_END=915 /DNA_ORIENTATION=-
MLNPQQTRIFVGIVGGFFLVAALVGLYHVNVASAVYVHAREARLSQFPPFGVAICPVLSFQDSNCDLSAVYQNDVFNLECTESSVTPGAHESKSCGSSQSFVMQFAGYDMRCAFQEIPDMNKPSDRLEAWTIKASYFDSTGQVAECDAKGNGAMIFIKGKGEVESHSVNDAQHFHIDPAERLRLGLKATRTKFRNDTVRDHFYIVNHDISDCFSCKSGEQTDSYQVEITIMNTASSFLVPVYEEMFTYTWGDYGNHLLQMVNACLSVLCVFFLITLYTSKTNPTQQVELPTRA